MFCPKCGTDNINEARFCRACGMDISVVPMVLTGELNSVFEKSPKRATRNLRRKARREERLNWKEAMSGLFVGIAFLIIFALGVFFMPQFFWVGVWFIIPALACIGSGLGEVLQLRHKEKLLLAQNQSQTPTSLLQARPDVSQFPVKDTNEFISAPPGITENTTRQLGAETPVKVFEKRN